MPRLDDITPLILTWNEAPNLGRTLARLTWAREVIIVDSGSTDGTQQIAAQHPGARVLERAFDSFADQCNYGLAQIRTPWVLSLDADYVLGAGWEAEVAACSENPEVFGYRCAFDYWIAGHPLRACLYPPRVVLHRAKGARYENDGHGHRVVTEGGVAPLKTHIAHDDRKPLSRWLLSQDKYAVQEADKLLAAEAKTLGPPDRLRRTGWAALPAVLVYTLLVKGVLFDGWRGWYYALQRLLAEMLLALRLLERRLNREDNP